MADSHVGSALPPHMREVVLSTLPQNPEEGWYAETGAACEGANFHSPTPLTLVDAWITPKPIGTAKDASDYIVHLCPTCAANLKVLLALLTASGGELPWPVRREFGNKLRALAKRGWDRYVKDQHA